MKQLTFIRFLLLASKVLGIGPFYSSTGPTKEPLVFSLAQEKSLAFGKVPLLKKEVRLSEAISVRLPCLMTHLTKQFDIQGPLVRTPIKRLQHSYIQDSHQQNDRIHEFPSPMYLCHPTWGQHLLPVLPPKSG